MKNNLIPAVIQDFKSKKILMVGFMNDEALQKSKKEKIIWFWSRSRNKLWKKGETSGVFLKVKKMFTDCDDDSLLFQVIPQGTKKVCHTGKKSCFRKL